MKSKFKLPSGARLLARPALLKIGSWVLMKYDATVTRHGIKWYRAENSFGNNGNRQDWVANLPSGCLSVTQYKGKKWGDGLTEYKSFDAAVIGETKDFIRHEKKSVKELRAKTKLAEKTVALVVLSISKT